MRVGAPPAPPPPPPPLPPPASHRNATRWVFARQPAKCQWRLLECGTDEPVTRTCVPPRPPPLARALAPAPCVPARPPALARGLGAAPGRGAAAGGRARGRPAAGPRGTRHRQDDHD